METMGTEKKQYEEHNFKSFLKRHRVIIPMVQRDYAQGRTTEDVTRVRNRFLDAIKNALQKSQLLKLDFVYGEKEKVWNEDEVNKLDSIIVTPLDGQQRLTTLYLLHWFAAQKSNLEKKEFAFLNNFTYDIRPSSRDFCQQLMKYTVEWNKSLSGQLKDQNWFMGEWHNDPTIISMLVMLDAINEKFDNMPNLWERLTGEKPSIVFYFLPLSENGFSDELYIKMNSRGKNLTAFEHFKAEYEDLYERDSEESRIISHKFDVEWIDVLFPYRNLANNLVDNEFMRYFYYISHILCYKQDIEKSDDEFRLIDLVYKNSSQAEKNRKFFEKAFDCWYDVLKKYGSIDSFFKKFISDSSYEENKVSTFKSVQEYNGNQDFFCACIKLYQVNNNFSYGDFLFLFGIVTYLINSDKIEETDFIKRIRILRNLIWNSNSGEIRGEADYMKDLIEEVEILMVTGEINQQRTHSFNGFQESEEIYKQSHRDLDFTNLYKFEDHSLIYGYISGLGYENLDLADTFIKLFSHNPDFVKIHQALLAIGDYRQNDTNPQNEYYRYYMGNANRSTWSQLLHKSRRNNFDEKTMPVLRELLKRIKNGETLDAIIQKYLSDQETVRHYDWRYYFVKYPAMLRGADGELKWKTTSDYTCITLNKHQFNGQHWNSFLNVIYQELSNEYKIDLDNFGGFLNILAPIASLEATETGFIYYYQETAEEWNIEQENSIDKEDRIRMAIDNLKKCLLTLNN